MYKLHWQLPSDVPWHIEIEKYPLGNGDPRWAKSRYITLLERAPIFKYVPNAYLNDAYLMI